jgi:hypothetical protein
MKKDIRPLFDIDWAQPYSGIVKITPEDAKRVLDQHNSGNRYMRVAGSAYIAVQIRSGEWQEDHPQPICFSEESTLLDGQHRMAGIAISGKEVWASCRFGVKPHLIQYIDTGITRQLADRVDFVENKKYNKFISSMIQVRQMMKIKTKATPEQALSLFHEMSRSYIEIAATHQPKRYVGTAVIGLVFAEYHNRYGEEAKDMYKELFKLSTDCQPAQALRNFIQGTTLFGRTLYPYVVAACIANHEGRNVKVIRAASWR